MENSISKAHLLQPEGDFFMQNSLVLHQSPLTLHRSFFPFDIWRAHSASRIHQVHQASTLSIFLPEPTNRTLNNFFNRILQQTPLNSLEPSLTTKKTHAPSIRTPPFGLIFSAWAWPRKPKFVSTCTTHNLGLNFPSLSGPLPAFLHFLMFFCVN